ncbi:MAG: GDSL-type esterase/lipase family protein [Planctomycetota bacterium]|nr:GDSL-type esterase/lipase family protein [Planctomycetota bacterium]
MARIIAFTLGAVWMTVVTATAAELSMDDVAQRLHTGQPTRIVCFGDSITGAYYHTGGQRAWCDMLGLALHKAYPHANIEVFNAGISGHTTVNALARIENDVLARQPHLVVVMFGMNDVARVPLEQFRENTRSIAGRCLDSGSAVVLCTPNSVYDNSARPNGRLAEFSQAVREVATKMKLPLVDCFAAWQQIRQDDPAGWMLMMSDEIHPNMNGHKRFAELITKSATGKAVSLDESPPLDDALHHTFDMLHAKKPVKLVTSPPYDEIFPAAIRAHFADTEFHVTSWPVEGQTLAEISNWAKQIRGMNPDLVVPAIPASVASPDLGAFIRDYEWVLNWSFQFAGRPWDVVPVLPTVAGEVPAESQSFADAAQHIAIGKDVRFIDRSLDDVRSTQEVVAAWVTEQKRSWQGARNRLPPRNDHVFVPAQSWPHQPGPRSVRTSIYYPGGKLDNVDERTGIMLTLHNWGGEDCVGTASPQALADRLNVVAVCVNYLQSGRKASIEDPEPYDYGYLQSLDALRALAFVRNGLKQAEHAYDDSRLFCTGGSGGGNVTLMANKLAPRTFACVVDMCGMKKLSDDIAFNLPGGSGLDARWSQHPDSPNYLSADEQELRFAGHPKHLTTMKSIEASGKIIVVHGVDDTTCPYEDAREMVANMQAADLDVEPHFITKDDLDGSVFASTGHALGNRTEIVFRVAGKYLAADSPQALRRTGPCDFDRREEIRYETTNGHVVISYNSGVPVGAFEPTAR